MIHDFWVPAFRMKIDAVPGIDTHMRVTTTDRIGEFPVVCAELCGLGHSTMRQSAHVMTARGLRRQAGRARPRARRRRRRGGGGGGETDGKTLFTDAAEPTACDSCHTLADAGATGTTGPNLDEVLPDLSEAEIRESIVDPDAEITEGFQPGLMPRYGDTLSEEQVDALVKYLMEVAGRVTARLRAPGLTRGFVFFVIGVLFSAALVLLVRAAVRLPELRRRADHQGPERDPARSLLFAPLFFFVGIGAFDYWFYYMSGPPDAARRTTPATAPTRGRTTSASTPITR